MAYPEVLQLFNDDIYPMRISVQKSLIKVAIYETYGMKWGGPGPPLNLRIGDRDPWAPPHNAYDSQYIPHFFYSNYTFHG